MQLETTRLVLREFVTDDWQAVHNYAAHAMVLRYMPGDPPTREQVRETIAWMIRGKDDNPPHYNFAVTVQPEPRPVGWCAIRIRYDELRQGELMYALHPDHWGNGYATEAASAALDFGFANLGLHRIFATCRPNNIASWRVLERLGMRREGHLHRHRWVRDQWQDSYLYAILEDERN